VVRDARPGPGDVDDHVPRSLRQPDRSRPGPGEAKARRQGPGHPDEHAEQQQPRLELHLRESDGERLRRHPQQQPERPVAVLRRRQPLSQQQRRHHLRVADRPRQPRS
jgi:hypothetical protein